MGRSRDRDLLKQVGARVAEARRERGLTQERLAEIIDIQPVSLSRLETGDRALSLSTLGLISDALGVTLGDLLDGTRPMPEQEHAPGAWELLDVFDHLPLKKQRLLIEIAKAFAPA